MNNKLEKAKFLAKHVKKGNIADLGSEDNYGSLNHIYLENELMQKILRVDKYGHPDVKTDLNKKFPFADNIFDTIIISEIIEHMHSPHHFLMECKRILKDDGRILLTTPNGSGLNEFNLLPLILNISHDEPYNEDIMCWNKHNMDDLVKNVGLNILKFEYIQFYWNRNYVYRFLSFIFKRLKPTLFYLLTK